jgi:peptide-methionine (S)-S-oxide reductase
MIRFIFMFMIAAAAAYGEDAMTEETSTTKVATFGAGCFWCVEAVFEQLPGVLDVESGYMGGTTENPTYKEISRGDTGHAEVTRITYDPSRTTFDQLLDMFWTSHDPTQLNRQGADVGTQYRSVIFFHDDEQRAQAEASKAALDASGELDRPVVTEISAASTYYPAEDYHQDYYQNNANAPYCMFVIRPKLKKLGLKP